MPLLDAKQVAVRLCVSARLAHHLMREMNPVNVGCGGRRMLLRVRTSELERWMRERTITPEYGTLEIIKPHRPKQMDYAEMGLTPEGHVPYKRAASEANRSR